MSSRAPSFFFNSNTWLYGLAIITGFPNRDRHPPSAVPSQVQSCHLRSHHSVDLVSPLRRRRFNPRVPPFRGHPIFPASAWSFLYTPICILECRDQFPTVLSHRIRRCPKPPPHPSDSFSPRCAPNPQAVFPALTLTDLTFPLPFFPISVTPLPDVKFSFVFRRTFLSEFSGPPHLTGLHTPPYTNLHNVRLVFPFPLKSCVFLIPSLG